MLPLLQLQPLLPLQLPFQHNTELLPRFLLLSWLSCGTFRGIGAPVALTRTRADCAVAIPPLGFDHFLETANIECLGGQQEGMAHHRAFTCSE
jgi:hypothetical protein